MPKVSLKAEKGRHDPMPFLPDYILRRPIISEPFGHDGNGAKPRKVLCNQALVIDEGPPRAVPNLML